MSFGFPGDYIPQQPMWPFDETPEERQRRRDYYDYLNQIQREQDRAYAEQQRAIQEQERQRQELERQGVYGLRETQAGVDLATLQANLAHQLGSEQVRTLHALPGQLAGGQADLARTQAQNARALEQDKLRTQQMGLQSQQMGLGSTQMGTRGLQEGNQFNQGFSPAVSRRLLGF